MRILFVISALERDGAQRQLLLLSRYLSEVGHEVHIASMTGSGPLDSAARRQGATLHIADPTGIGRRLGSLVWLVRLVRKVRPNIVHSYLTEQNAKVMAVKWAFRGVPVVWGVRSAGLRFRDHGLRSWLAWRASVLLSKGVDLVICNSIAGRDRVVAAGYPTDRVSVVPNGLEEARFTVDRERGESFRESHLPGTFGPVVGMVGRWDFDKGQDLLPSVAALVTNQVPSVKFLVVGRHTDEQLTAFLASVEEADPKPQMAVLPEVEDTSVVLNAVDVLVVPSRNEGFPNVILEAMACGVPVVATDAGDARQIIGQLGHVVPVGNREAIARAVVEVLAGWSQPPVALRRAVVLQYSVEELGRKTLDLLADLHRSTHRC